VVDVQGNERAPSNSTQAVMCAHVWVFRWLGGTAVSAGPFLRLLACVLYLPVCVGGSVFNDFVPARR
jgi:hypothetical protein